MSISPPSFGADHVYLQATKLYSKDVSRGVSDMARKVTTATATRQDNETTMTALTLSDVAEVLQTELDRFTLSGEGQTTCPASVQLYVAYVRVVNSYGRLTCLCIIVHDYMCHLCCCADFLLVGMRW